MTLHPPRSPRYPVRMPPHETPPAGKEEPALASALRELLDCTELNMDDLEEHTRAVIQKARDALAAHPAA